MPSTRPVIHVAAALIRRGAELLMVRQAAPGEEPFWSTPGGAIEEDELVTEGVVREVHEETGLRVTDSGTLAFIVQIDERRPVQPHESRGARSGYLATVWTFDVAAWDGDVVPSDPDGFVSEARFMALDEALRHLERISWQALTVRYLRGELDPGSLCLLRRHADDRLELVGTVAPRR